MLEPDALKIDAPALFSVEGFEEASLMELKKEVVEEIDEAADAAALCRAKRTKSIPIGKRSIATHEVLEDKLREIENRKGKPQPEPASQPAVAPHRSLLRPRTA
jgi:urease accessory protein UreF